MSLILRVDVDKPYGNASLTRSIASKLSEDYWFPDRIYKTRYLIHLAEFLGLCNKENIAGHIYFRMCTVPDEKIVELVKKGGHRIGFHAENTRSLETFSAEWNDFEEVVSPEKVSSFSKHGSGTLKLGKQHYAPYEPEKYKDWAMELNTRFYFGNGICKSIDDLIPKNDFYPNMFWIEREYRDNSFSGFDQLLKIAKNKDVPVLIHPCNYERSRVVANDFKELIKLSKENNIDWKVYE